MKTKTTTPVAPTKRVITSQTEALRVLRDYVRSADFSTTPYYTIGTSKARWVSVMQLVEWFKTNRNEDINAGWLGRTLVAAAANGLAITTSTVMQGKNSITVYRNAKA